MKHLSTIFFLFFSFCNYSFSQLNLTLRLDKKLNPSKLNVFYFDGEVFKAIHPKFENSLAIINEPIKSRYARVVINYTNKAGQPSGQCFLVTKGLSTLEFKEVADSSTNSLSNYKAKNLINVENTSIYNAINKYTKNELTNFNKTKDAYDKFPNDSILKLRDRSYETLAFKQIDYIKLHATNYFYFEKFINEIVPALKDKYLAEFYEIFNTSFPDSFKNSYEGKSAKVLLEGKLFVKIGMQSPYFKTTDYLGNDIGSENLKGKYYLLSFWATWCSPCIAEIPQLKRIRETYDQSKLAIISISSDKDSTKFITGITKYKMNWTHVFNSYKMSNLFGAKPIPSLYLIDNNGKIIFSSWEKTLPELEVILKNELKNKYFSE